MLDSVKNISELPVGTTFEAQTLNTLYRFEITAEGVTVDDGGERCPDGPAPTRVWYDYISVGACIIMDHPAYEGNKFLRTSPVQSICLTTGI